MNIFDVFSKPITEEDRTNFEAQISKMKSIDFQKQLIDFLKSADAQALLKFQFTAKMIVFRGVNENYGIIKYLSSNTNERDLIIEQLKKIDTGPISISNILLDETHIQEFKEFLKATENKVNAIFYNANTKYWVAFLSKTNIVYVYEKTFNSSLEAEKYICSLDKTESNQFYILETNIKINYQEFSDKIKASKLADPLDPEGIIQSKTQVTCLKQEGRIDPVFGTRIFQQYVTTDLIKTIERLDALIEKLKETSSIWVFIESLFSKNGAGLTGRKIEALTDIKEHVLTQSEELQTGAQSLKNVIEEGLGQKQLDNPTQTYKQLLNEHRFSGIGKTATGISIDEIVESSNTNKKI